MNFRNVRIIPGEDGRNGSTGNHRARNTGELETVTTTDTGAIPTRGEALMRGLGVGRLRDGTETFRIYRFRTQSGSFTTPEDGRIARRTKLVLVVMSLRSWFPDLVATVKTKRHPLKKSQALNSLGHFLRTPTPSGVSSLSIVSPQKHVSPKNDGASTPLKMTRCFLSCTSIGRVPTSWAGTAA